MLIGVYYKKQHNDSFQRTRYKGRERLLRALSLLSVFDAYATVPPNSPVIPITSFAHPSPVTTTTSSISSNPAAVNVTTGSGVLQQFIQQKLGIKDNHGIELQGAWIGDTNNLFSGGIPQAKKWTSNSVGLADLAIDTQRFNGWKGGLFSAQFLQQNAQNTNVSLAHK